MKDSREICLMSRKLKKEKEQMAISTRELTHREPADGAAAERKKLKEELLAAHRLKSRRKASRTRTHTSSLSTVLSHSRHSPNKHSPSKHSLGEHSPSKYPPGEHSAGGHPQSVRAPVRPRGKAPPIDPYAGEDLEVRMDDWLPALKRTALWNGWSEA